MIFKDYMVYGHIESLNAVTPDRIPSMVDFPIRKILKLHPDKWGFLENDHWVHFGRGLIWDMGFGPAKKLDELRRNGFTVGGYDINSLAVKAARERADFFGSTGDVRFFGRGDEVMWDTVTYLENVDALLYQAVFPSLLGDDWKSALDAADMILRPGGHIFIGDFLDASKVYPQLFTRRELLGEKVWNESAERWKRRYEVNYRAFGDLGLPYGTFAVGAVGPHKFEYDWSDDPRLLRSLYDIREIMPEGFERFARHIDGNQLVEYVVDELGYKLIEETYVSRRSRSTTPDKRWNIAPGIEWTFQKQSTYKYHPWKYGLDPDNPKTYLVGRRRKGSPLRGDSYERAYYGYLLKRVRSSQRPVFERMARLLGVPF